MKGNAYTKKAKRINLQNFRRKTKSSFFIEKKRIKKITKQNKKKFIFSNKQPFIIDLKKLEAIVISLFILCYYTITFLSLSKILL